MSTVLVVDDETSLRELIRAYLERDGYTVVEASTGKEALASAALHNPDIIVLDLMIPEIDGTEVCRRIRSSSDVYIIMVTAKADEVDRVVGLEVGADDYLTKPFSPRELVARVRALLRRPRAQVVAARVLRFGDLTIDVEAHEVRLGNDVIMLTATEYRLIALLASTPATAMPCRTRLQQCAC
ncbi:MAG: DNA-binding response regulator [Chloroflexia bacterium]|nr:DNA-binding response regulator [Chloroflexia bacterium]